MAHQVSPDFPDPLVMTVALGYLAHRVMMGGQADQECPGHRAHKV